MRSKRGAYFFVIDVVIVFFILLTTVITILSFSNSRPSLLGINQQLDAFSIELYEIEIRDYESTTLSQLKIPGGAIYENNWNTQMTLDELIVLLIETGDFHNATQLINETVRELPRKYGFNYTISNATDTLTLYSRDGLISIDRSSVKLSEKKISWPRGNLNNTYTPWVTEVVIWE